MPPKPMETQKTMKKKKKVKLKDDSLEGGKPGNEDLIGTNNEEIKRCCNFSNEDEINRIYNNNNSNSGNSNNFSTNNINALGSINNSYSVSNINCSIESDGNRDGDYGFNDIGEGGAIEEGIRRFIQITEEGNTKRKEDNTEERPNEEGKLRSRVGVEEEVEGVKEGELVVIDTDLVYEIIKRWKIRIEPYLDRTS
ncbi:hypothetical protein BY996DRAFT_1371311 [Phakopsora pachyrhizi]|nr:hypothetical protein BY996DRAFT_1371311 [Phakopsora pachyrhizi]